MHGNRDFLVSEKICKSLKIELLEDPHILSINDMRILLLWGTLCTDDRDYQAFRSMVRSNKWQNEMLSNH